MELLTIPKDTIDNIPVYNYYMELLLENNIRDKCKVEQFKKRVKNIRCKWDMLDLLLDINECIDSEYIESENFRYLWKPWKILFSMITQDLTK